MRIPLRGKMASTGDFPITVDCSKADPNQCESIIDTASAKICANSTTSGNPCTCDNAYPNVAGATTDTKCTVSDLTCSKLGEKACGQSSYCTFDTECKCDPKKNLVPDD